jgi:Family of unknown function (DUF6427)
MIRFFKSSFLIQFCVIGITGLILWGKAFFEPPFLPEPEGFVPFYSFLYSLLSGFPLIQVISGCFLVIGSTLILNHVLHNHRIVQKNSSLAGFIFIILMSYHSEFLTIQPVNIAVFFLLLILNQLLKSYNKEEPLDLIYSAGFFVAIGSYAYFPSIFFYGFILISFIIFRSGKWREWISSFFGLLTPFLFLAVYYFWSDQLMARIHEYLGMFTVHSDLKFSKNPVYIILTSIIILFFLYSLVYSISNRTEKTIEKKRKNLLFNWIIFFVLVSFPFTSKMTLYHIELAFITFSGLIAFYLLQIRKSFWQELIFLLLLLFLISNNLFFRLS